MKKIVKFKYHPNIYDLDILSEDKKVCQCCNEETEIFYDQMYCVENINCLCLDCIASGDAAKKFKGTFIQDAEVSKVHDRRKYAELFEKTPGYESWQGESWLACCDDFCAFIQEVGTKELEEMGIADEVFEEYNKRNEVKDAREYLVKGGSLAGYLFQCLHCKKYHLGADAD